MFHLKSAASKRVSAYFASPKTTYEHFVNKKWNERKNLDESKQNFLHRVIKDLKMLPTLNV